MIMICATKQESPPDPTLFFKAYLNSVNQKLNEKKEREKTKDKVKATEEDTQP